MLYAFGFERIGVVASDLYFVDPNPGPGQEGPEQGVRVEVRLLERGELQRLDLFGAADRGRARRSGAPTCSSRSSTPARSTARTTTRGSRGWEPGGRKFVKEMTANPVAWVGKYLSDVEGHARSGGGVSPDEVGESDADELRAATPDIMDAVRRLLDRVRAGELALPPRRRGRQRPPQLALNRTPRAGRSLRSCQYAPRGAARADADQR